MGRSTFTPMAAPTGFFALRTPLLPMDEFFAWSDGLQAPSAPDDEERLASALAADRRVLRERLRAIVGRAEVREALFIASPSLEESLPVWLEQPDSERGRKVERALVRYFTRMTWRPTPFGLFAGCSVGTTGDTTHLEIASRAQYRRHTRLDNDYLSSVADVVGRVPAIRRLLTYRPNSSLYRSAGRLRYVKRNVDSHGRSSHLVSAEPTDYLEATLARAAEGARIDALAAALVDGDVTESEALEFVDALIDGQLLVSDFQPQVTGEEPIHELVRQLRAVAHEDAAADRFADPLSKVQAALTALEQCSSAISPQQYRAIADELEPIPVERDLSRLFQVDLVKPAPAATLGPGPLSDIVHAVDVLHRLARRRSGGPLGRFCEAFEKRYEDREVPLTEVLDEESGIGFERSDAPGSDASPLLAGLALGARSEPQDKTTGAHFEFLFARLEKALTAKEREIVLDEADLEKMTLRSSQDEPVDAPLPDSVAAMVTLVAASESALQSGDYRILLHSVSGPSGANMLGRFCHGDESLARHVRAHLKLEEARRPDALFVEVVHLPDGRMCNVLLRPLLREYELAFLGRSGAPRGNQIDVQDLDVSVRNGRVRLRSRRLGREVIPRLTTAHNFSDPFHLGTYRFLCALQLQDVTPLGFGWGALEMATFLPRLRIGRVILSAARWRFDKDALEELTQSDGRRQFAAAQALRRRHRLPRHVAWVDRESSLSIDLDNVLSVETFAHSAKGRDEVTLTELFADETPVVGPEGRFAHELVVPLLTRPSHASSSPAVATAAPESRVATQETRTFLPGSEWLYVKLYTGPVTADAVLRDVVAPVVADARATAAIDSWFFIRYGDPDWHLRVRFHGEPSRLRAEVLPQLQDRAAAMNAAGLVWKLQCDTYEREITRYGGDAGIRLSEQLFFADSDAALRVVEILADEESADARWCIVLRGMDQLLDDLGLAIEEKRAVVERSRVSFGSAFNAQQALLGRQMGQRFRERRSQLEALLNRAHDAGSSLAAAFAAYDERSARLGPIVASLRDAASSGRLGDSLANLAASYLHMHANRLFRSSARAQELVLYDFLSRLYLGQIARLPRR